MRELRAGRETLNFVHVNLSYRGEPVVNVFREYRRKTLRDTLRKPRYAGLLPQVEQSYGDFLREPLGEFLYSLKQHQDHFYRRFLNRWGDRIYCTFSPEESSWCTRKGLYTFFVDQELKYVGKTKDNFGRRISQGYGRIHPKNCYLDGQATNCHLNSCIAENYDRVTFFVFPLDDNEASRMESTLIRGYQPEWNIAQRSSFAAPDDALVKEGL